jgi:hypothetical protein
MRRLKGLEAAASPPACRGKHMPSRDYTTQPLVEQHCQCSKRQHRCGSYNWDTHSWDAMTYRQEAWPDAPLIGPGSKADGSVVAPTAVAACGAPMHVSQGGTCKNTNKEVSRSPFCIPSKDWAVGHQCVHSRPSKGALLACMREGHYPVAFPAADRETISHISHWQGRHPLWVWL